MSISSMPKSSMSEQRNKFQDLARQLECDEDEARFGEAVKKVTKAPKSEGEPKERKS